MIEIDTNICVDSLKKFVREHKNFKVNNKIKNLINKLKLEDNNIECVEDFTLNVIRYFILCEKNKKVKEELMWLENGLTVDLYC